MPFAESRYHELVSSMQTALSLDYLTMDDRNFVAQTLSMFELNGPSVRLNEREIAKLATILSSHKKGAPFRMKTTEPRIRRIYHPDTNFQNKKVQDTGTPMVSEVISFAALLIFLFGILACLIYVL